MKNILSSLIAIAMMTLSLSATAMEIDESLDSVATPEEIFAELQAENAEILANEDQADDGLMTPINRARVEVYVNKCTKGPGCQTMQVFVDGVQQYTWKVSTGRNKWETAKSGRRYFTSTPRGSWTPYGMTRLHRSRTWNADMPFSIWLTGGIAIHAAAPAYEKYLGSINSGGCVRLSYRNAETLYRLVEQYGRKNTRVTIY